MRKIYRTRDRGGAMIVGLVFMGGGGGFVVLSVLGGLGIVGDAVDGAAGVFGVAFVVAMGVLTFYAGATEVIVLPYEIRMKVDGTVEFVKVLGRTTVRVNDILGIERSLRKVGGEDEDARQLRVQYSGGSVSIPYFADIEHFIVEVQTLNPRIALGGQW